MPETETESRAMYADTCYRMSDSVLLPLAIRGQIVVYVAPRGYGFHPQHMVRLPGRQWRYYVNLADIGEAIG